MNLDNTAPTARKVTSTFSVSFGLILNHSGSQSHLTNLETGAPMCGKSLRGTWGMYAIQGVDHYQAQAARMPSTHCATCVVEALALDEAIMSRLADLIVATA